MQKFDTVRTTLAEGLSGTKAKRRAKKLNKRRERRASKAVMDEPMRVRKTLGTEAW